MNPFAPRKPMQRTPEPQVRTGVDFTVVGTPAAQGSMVVHRGRVRHASNDSLVSWREAVGWACKEEMRRTEGYNPWALPILHPWNGPVEIELYFTYQPRRKAEAEGPKVTAPDLDKLTRAVLDALTGVLYEDDRQVVSIQVRKGYGEWEGWADGKPEKTHLAVSARQTAAAGLVAS